MPSEFDDNFEDAAEVLQEVFGERTPTGALDEAAAVYVAANGKVHPISVSRGASRVSEVDETDDGYTEIHSVRQEVETIAVWHGDGAGRLKVKVDLAGVFKFPVNGGWEVWFVQEVDAGSPTMSRVVIQRDLDVNRDRPGTQ